MKRMFRGDWIVLAILTVSICVGCGSGLKKVETTPPADEKPPEVEMPALPPA